MILAVMKKCLVISLPIRNKQGIGVDLTSESNWLIDLVLLVKPSVVLVLVCVKPSSNLMIGFTFAPHLFVKTSNLTHCQ